MTESQVRKLLAVMTAALPREWSFLTREQQETTEGIYVSMLDDLSYPAASAAVEALIATATKMPTIAEVRAATLRAMHGEVRPGGDAWGDLRMMRSRGFSTYRPPADADFADQITARCVRALGWRELCLSEDETADRARFIELYDKLARAYRHEVNTSQLPAAQRYRALQAADKRQLAEGARTETIGLAALRVLAAASPITDGENT